MQLNFASFTLAAVVLAGTAYAQDPGFIYTVRSFASSDCSGSFVRGDEGGLSAFCLDLQGWGSGVAASLTYAANPDCTLRVYSEPECAGQANVQEVGNVTCIHPATQPVRSYSVICPDIN